MANNRMWLIHKPSKLGIMLGKRMGWGWYRAPKEEEFNRFFEYLSENPDGSQDDFLLVIEDCAGSSCFGEWKYTDEKESGFSKFDFADEGSCQKRPWVKGERK